MQYARDDEGTYFRQIYDFKYCNSNEFPNPLFYQKWLTRKISETSEYHGNP
jgi:hypothetical protein